MIRNWVLKDKEKFCARMRSIDLFSFVHVRARKFSTTETKNAILSFKSQTGTRSREVLKRKTRNIQTYFRYAKVSYPWTQNSDSARVDQQILKLPLQHHVKEFYDDTESRSYPGLCACRTYCRTPQAFARICNEPTAQFRFIL